MESLQHMSVKHLSKIHVSVIKPSQRRESALPISNTYQSKTQIILHPKYLSCFLGRNQKKRDIDEEVMQQLGNVLSRYCRLSRHLWIFWDVNNLFSKWDFTTQKKSIFWREHREVSTIKALSNISTSEMNYVYSSPLDNKPKNRRYLKILTSIIETRIVKKTYSWQISTSRTNL